MIPSRPAVLLFDVDGTLLHAGGAGRRALEGAMAELLDGRVSPPARWLGEMKLDGMTDRAIVREAVEALGLPYDDAFGERVLARYAERLEVEIRGPGYEVLPGVEELLGALAARGAPVGLCTGNIRRGAQVKLARGGLDRHFGFDEGAVFGFAGDGERRSDIVRAAVRRAGARLGRPVAPGEALVIGDTPRDVEGAHEAGVPALAVATGRFGADELRAHGADAVVPTLELRHVAALLLGG